MANAGKLEVQIGADITDFEKKIKEVEFDIKELSKVKLEQIKLGLDTKQISAQIKDAKANLNGLKTAVKDTGNAFSAAAPKIANGGNTLMQFSRIAQDAPFGIMGIGNNITATAESFNYLKQQTGSTGGALKALAGSIMGSGGILLGVSLLTTGLTLMSQSGLSVSDVIDKITGNFDGFKRSLSEANKEAAKNSATEVLNVQNYVAIAKDRNLSDKERLIAVKKLQEEYPAYFGNLTKEQILTGNVGTALNDVVAALKDKARAQAYAGKLGDLAAKELELREKESDLINKSKDAYSEVLRMKKRITEEGSTDRTRQQLAGARGSLIEYQDSLKDVKTELSGVLTEMNKWAAKAEVKTKASVLLEFKEEPVKKTPKPKEVKDKTHASFDSSFIAPFVSTISGLGDTMAGFEDRTRTAFQNATGIVKEQTDLMAQALVDFNNSANDLIVNSISSTFANLGTAIGEALATGGNVLLSIGQTILQGLANFLSGMGDLLIKYGTLAVVKGKLDLAILAGGPVSIAAGLAAVAVGVALKAASGAIGSFAKGGGRGGASSSTGSGANNNSFTSGGFSQASSSGGTVIFEIAGQKLVGVLSNTLNGNKRLGGQLGL